MDDFDYLLTRPSDEIINYCEMNASPLCQSPDFWKMKAQRDFNMNLDSINATTPALKYKTIKEIFTSPRPLVNSILIYDQEQLLNMLTEDELRQLDVNDPQLLMKLVEDLESGYYVMMNALEWTINTSTLSVDEATNLLTDLTTTLYIFAVQRKYYSAAASLSDTNMVDFRTALPAIFDNEMAEFIMADAAQHGIDDKESVWAR
jgi:hypothetical protein